MRGIEDPIPVAIRTPNRYFKVELGDQDMAGSQELTRFEDLRRFRLADEGYFVITDTIRPTLVHRVNSKCIKTDSFNLKVVIKQRKQGSYFWVDSLATAAHEFAAQRCKVCKPELFLVPRLTFDG